MNYLHFPFKKISKIILFPHYLGQPKPGVANTPDIIKNMLHPTRNIYFNTPIKKNIYNNLNNLYKINNSIATPKINIGGDHSMALGSVASSIYKYPNMKINLD